MKLTQTGRVWALLALSTALGGMAAWAIDRHLDHKTREIERAEQGQQVTRVVAARAIEAGAILQLSDLAMREIPLRWVDPDSIATTDVARVVGMQATAPLAAGQPILSAHVAPRSEAGLATRLAPGKRAVTIPVDQISSLSGMLSPGDVIDLYVSFEHRGRRLTAPLLSEVQVLATGRQVASADEVAGVQPSEYATVTLETTSAEAVKLVAARQDGAITAVLSTQGVQGGNSRSDGPAARGAGHLAGLLGLEKPGAPAPIPVIYGDRLMPIEPGDPIDAESGAPESATGQVLR